MATYRTRVAGVSFANADGSSRQALLRVLQNGEATVKP